jgi:hypothetical protein
MHLQQKLIHNRSSIGMSLILFMALLTCLLFHRPSLAQCVPYPKMTQHVPSHCIVSLKLKFITADRMSLVSPPPSQFKWQDNTLN